MSTMFNTKEIKLVAKAFGDMDDCFIKSVTNQKQSDGLFALAQGQCYTSLGGYIAQITFSDGYNQTMYISESDAPGYKIRENGRNFFTVPAVFVIHILLSSELFR